MNSENSNSIGTEVRPGSTQRKVQLTEGGTQTTPDIPEVLSPSHPYYLFAYPIISLVKYLVLSQPRQLESQCTSVTARTLKLVSLCDETVESWKFMGLPEARMLRQASQQVTALTPQVIEEAQMLSEQSQSILSHEEIQSLVCIAKEWVNKLGNMLEPLEKFLTPWSHTGHCLLELIVQGKRHRLDRQLERVNSLSSSVVELADASLESLFLMNRGGDAKDAREIERAATRQKIQNLTEELKQIVPMIMDCSREAPVVKDDVIFQEQIAVMCIEWSAKVNGILSCSDQLSTGVNQPAHFLLVSIEEGSSRSTVQKAIGDLNYYTSELKEVGNAAISGCSDQNTARLVKGACRDMERVLVKITALSESVYRDQVKLELREDLEVLMRHWAIKAAIITCIVDELSLQVSGPVDQLGGVALAIGLADTSSSREELKEQLDNIAANFSRKITQMLTLARQINDPVKVGNTSLAKPLKSALISLKTATQNLIDSTISLSENSDQSNSHIFQHRRRQWTSLLMKIIYAIDAAEQNDQISKLSSLVQELLLHGIPDDPILEEESYPIDPLDPLDPKGTSGQIVSKPSTEQTSTNTHSIQQDMSSPFTMLSPDDISYSSHADNLNSYKLRQNNPFLLEDVVAMEQPDSKPSTYTQPGYATGSLASVAQKLYRQTDIYLDVGNPIVDISKELTQQMLRMSELAKSRGKQY